MLEVQGIDPERFAIEWVSSAEAPRFADLVNQFIGIFANGKDRRPAKVEPEDSRQPCRLHIWCVTFQIVGPWK